MTTPDSSTARRIRILGATAHPTGEWIVQLGRDLLIDLEDAGSRARFLIRDRDSKFTAAFDALLTDAGVEVVTTGIRIPRMNSLIERWIQTCRHELLDRTLIRNEPHLRRPLHQFEQHHNDHRPDQAMNQALILPHRRNPLSRTDDILGRRRPVR